VLRNELTALEGQAVALGGLFAASRRVSVQEFEAYARTTLARSDLLAIAFLERIPHARRAGFERRLGTRITSRPGSSAPAPRRPFYDVARLLASRDPARRMAGLDVHGDPVRSPALRRAVDSRRPGAVALRLQSTGEPGLVVYQAVFGPGRPEGVRGFAVSSFRLQDLMSIFPRALPRGTAVELRSGAERLAATGRPEGGRSVPVEFAGERWTLRVAAPEGGGLPAGPVALTGGLLLTALLTLAVALIARRAKRADRRAAEAERTTRFMLDELPDLAALRVDAAGRVLTATGGLFGRAGWRRDELEGSDLIALAPDRAHQLRAAIDAALAGVRHEQHLDGVRNVGLRYWMQAVPLATDAGAEVLLLMTDVTERDRLRAERERFFDVTSDLLCTTDVMGNFLACNAAWTSVLGHPADALAGRSYLELLHPDDAERTGAAAARIVGEAGGMVGFENRFRAADGSYRWLLWSAVYDRGTGAVFGAAKDISDRKAMEAELKRSNAQLEHFSSVVSHDLREPLRSIVGFAQLLERREAHKLSPEGREFLGFIGQGGARMQALVDGLLSVARIGRGRPALEPVDARAVAEHTLRDLARAIGERGARVELGELPTVQADPGQLGQVFQNLIANALKFADGAPEVEVAAEREPDGWRFDVRDRGVGIDPAQAQRVFGLFQRAHRRDQYDGAGVGLAVAQRIVESHGGRIWCGPAAGGGTVFSFTVPD